MSHEPAALVRTRGSSGGRLTGGSGRTAYGVATGLTRSLACIRWRDAEWSRTCRRTCGTSRVARQARRCDGPGRGTVVRLRRRRRVGLASSREVCLDAPAEASCRYDRSQAIVGAVLLGERSRQCLPLFDALARREVLRRPVA